MSGAQEIRTQLRTRALEGLTERGAAGLPGTDVGWRTMAALVAEGLVETFLRPHPVRHGLTLTWCRLRGPR